MIKLAPNRDRIQVVPAVILTARITSGYIAGYQEQLPSVSLI